MEKDSFVLHDDQFECFSLLPLEQRGLLITAIFEYRQTGTTTQELSEAAYMAYHLITRQLARDTQKYEKICAKRKAAIEARYAQENTKEYKCIQKNSNVADTETDTDTDTETETETDIISPPIILPKGKTDGDEKKIKPVEERFNEFWEAYPKKVGKEYARKCFEKLKPTAALTETMIKAIAEQKKSSEWIRNGGQYIPNPSTWLNQGRWQDELAPQVESTAPVVPKYSNFDAHEAFVKALVRSGRSEEEARRTRDEYK